MPSRLYKPLALAVFTALSLPALAVQVSDMSVFSAAGQPLRMDIELTDVGINPAATLVRVASAEEHARLGLTRPAWADGVRFKLLQGQGEKVVARASTSAPVTDDFVSFLVYIRADGQSRLQQVAAKPGGQAIAASSAKAIADNAAATKPKPKPKAPVAEAAPAVAEAPAAPAPVAAPASKPAPVASKPVASKPAAAAPAADTAEGIAQERKALNQGLEAAKAQVSDLESQLKALDAREASLKGAQAPAAEASAAPAPEAAPADAAPAADAAASDAATTDAAAAPAAEPAPAAEAAPAADKSSNDQDHFSPVPFLIMLGVFGLLAGLSHLFRRRTDSLPS